MQKLFQLAGGSHFVSVAGNYQLVPLMETQTLQQIMAAAAQHGTRWIVRSFGEVTQTAVGTRLRIMMLGRP